jgi:hypothetical protein
MQCIFPVSLICICSVPRVFHWGSAGSGFKVNDKSLRISLSVLRTRAGKPSTLSVYFCILSRRSTKRNKSRAREWTLMGHIFACKVLDWISRLAEEIVPTERCLLKLQIRLFGIPACRRYLSAVDIHTLVRFRSLDGLLAVFLLGLNLAVHDMLGIGAYRTVKIFCYTKKFQRTKRPLRAHFGEISDGKTLSLTISQLGEFAPHVIFHF